MKLNPSCFREYDIRGVADRDLDDELVTALGRVFASEIGDGGGRLIAVGRDCRRTSPRLRAALVAGITSAGLDVLDIGVVPSPLLYFAAANTSPRPDGAVIITGSHNPGRDNGFKLLRGSESLHGESIARLRRGIEAGEGRRSDVAGRVREDDVSEAYLEHALSTLRLGERRPVVVVDAGNGTGGPLACELYGRIGCQVTPLYCEMDGDFPNHHPDPTVAENLADLRARVVDQGAELGIALDGDADRIGVVDGEGHIIWGDQLMLLLGLELLSEVPGATFIGEVKCSQHMYDGLAAAGGVPIMWKVGHSLIKAKMKETGAALAGEMSGHLFFAHRYLGFDDGIYVGARLIELLSRSPRLLSEHHARLPVAVNTPEIRVDCADDVKFAVVERAVALLAAHPEVRELIDVDGARAIFSGGWGLIRASNTQASLVVRCEAESDSRLGEIVGVIESVIAAAREAAVG